MDDSKPLVSICVISYNSSVFVLETLESAKAQTYKNIELIVSDDGSSDDTVELCRNWLLENKDRFVRIELLTVEKNTGIPANCNRTVKAANGKWIKIIAADDILLDNCIEDNVNHVNGNPEIEIQFSEIQPFRVRGERRELLDSLKGDKLFFQLSVKEQYRELLISLPIPVTPSSFIKKQLIIDVGYFDEEFPQIEDYPFWLICTRAGNKLWYMDKLTVLYRLPDEEAAKLNVFQGGMISLIWYRNEKFRAKYFYPQLIPLAKWHRQYNFQIRKMFLGKKKSKINNILLRLLVQYFNPFHYLTNIHILLTPKREYRMLKKSIRELNFNYDR